MASTTYKQEELVAVIYARMAKLQKLTSENLLDNVPLKMGLLRQLLGSIYAVGPTGSGADDEFVETILSKTNPFNNTVILQNIGTLI